MQNAQEGLDRGYEAGCDEVSCRVVPRAADESQAGEFRTAPRAAEESLRV